MDEFMNDFAEKCSKLHYMYNTLEPGPQIC